MKQPIVFLVVDYYKRMLYRETMEDCSALKGSNPAIYGLYMVL